MGTSDRFVESEYSHGDLLVVVDEEQAYSKRPVNVKNIDVIKC